MAVILLAASAFVSEGRRWPSRRFYFVEILAVICIFEAPDAEAVRRTADELGYSYESLCRATVVD